MLFESRLGREEVIHAEPMRDPWGSCGEVAEAMAAAPARVALTPSPT